MATAPIVNQFAKEEGRRNRQETNFHVHDYKDSTLDLILLLFLWNILSSSFLITVIGERFYKRYRGKTSSYRGRSGSSELLLLSGFSENHWIPGEDLVAVAPSEFSLSIVH